MMRLMNKVILVTGGSQGIGESLVRRFAAEGAEVFIADVNADAGKQLASDLSSKGSSVCFIKLDVCQEKDWISALNTVVKLAGRVDVLVNNAGINVRETIEEMSEKNLDAMFDVNIKGPFLGIKHVIPHMRKNGGGAILNMSSVCGLIGHRYTPEAYTMTKGALTMLTKSVAVRYARENIRCNSVHPSTVATSMVEELFKDPARKAERLGEVPQGRLAALEDVASAFVYLASDEASFINGVSLAVDGGLTAG